jgi:hypothetical protein
MLKLTAAIFALALAGVAGSAESNASRIDASSARAFRQSLEAAKAVLSPADLETFGAALKHIWNEGTKAAMAEQRGYSEKDYYAQIDGLSYDEVIRFANESYGPAPVEYRAASNGNEAPVAAQNDLSSIAPGCPCEEAMPSLSSIERRSLRRIDASSETAFKESVALFHHKLSRSRRHAFDRALQDVWTEGTKKASAEQRAYTTSDYFAQLDGLSYDEVVRISDPTGAKEKVYRAEYYRATPGGMSSPPVRSGTQGQRWGVGFNTENVPRGGTDLYGVPGQNER